MHFWASVCVHLCKRAVVGGWGEANCKSMTVSMYIIIIMYIYHVLIDALSAHMIRILNTIFYTHVEHNPTKTIYINYYMESGHM